MVCLVLYCLAPSVHYSEDGAVFGKLTKTQRTPACLTVRSWLQPGKTTVHTVVSPMNEGRVELGQQPKSLTACYLSYLVLHERSGRTDRLFEMYSRSFKFGQILSGTCVCVCECVCVYVFVFVCVCGFVLCVCV